MHNVLQLASVLLERAQPIFNVAVLSEPIKSQRGAFSHERSHVTVEGVRTAWQEHLRGAAVT